MIKRKVSAMLAAVMLTASLAACAAGDGGSSPFGRGFLGTCQSGGIRSVCGVFRG